MNIKIIGDIFLEHYVLNNKHSFGGVMHSARMLSKYDFIEKSIAYNIPFYMKNNVNIELKSLGFDNMTFHKQYLESSNVFVINDIFENTLNGQYNRLFAISNKQLEVCELDVLDESILFFPSLNEELNYKYLKLFKEKDVKVFIDLNYLNLPLDVLKDIKHENLYLFISINKVNEEIILKLIKEMHFSLLVVKMNKGGSIVYRDDGTKVEIPCYIETEGISVGVGDVYDTAFAVSVLQNKELEVCGRIGSFYASLYSINHSETFESIPNYVEDKILYEISLKGVFSDWNMRYRSKIYLAGPDFSSGKRRKFEKLEEMLVSHNFNVVRPIIENGESYEDIDFLQEKTMYNKDRELIDTSDICLALLLDNDQGTLVEIGIFNTQNKIVILYDPYYIENNMFLKNTCQYIVHSLEKLFHVLYFCIGEIK